jgi:hypothetical protein
MPLGDLTTLAKVKEWLNTGSSAFPVTDDGLLGRLITGASRWLESYLSRPVAAADYSYTTNGAGTRAMYLPVQPVVSVSAVTVDGIKVPPSNPAPLGSGFLFDRSRVYLNGYVFSRGLQNVTVDYAAGLQITDESQLIPSDTPQIAVSALGRPWVTDRGARLPGSVAGLVKVADNPAADQYAVVASNGVYTYKFNVAQAGLVVLISYGYIPEDLEQALIELIGERYKQRTRIGQNSFNFGNGLVVSFMNRDMNENVRTILAQYKNVVPQSQ